MSSIKFEHWLFSSIFKRDSPNISDVGLHLIAKNGVFYSVNRYGHVGTLAVERGVKQ